jgi:hypothetical protein
LSSTAYSLHLASDETGLPAAAIIHLKTSMLVPNLHSEAVQLTDAIATVAALLEEIGRHVGVSLLDAEGDLIDFLDVRLNDTNIAFLPAGLGTRLKSDDRVLIRLVPIGGG